MTYKKIALKGEGDEKFLGAFRTAAQELQRGEKARVRFTVKKNNDGRLDVGNIYFVKLKSEIDRINR